MLQIALFVLLSIGLVIQYEVIFPLESYLFPASAASTLYIPHGIKTIMVVLSGYRALLPIFRLGQFRTCGTKQGPQCWINPCNRPFGHQCAIGHLVDQRLMVNRIINDLFK